MKEIWKYSRWEEIEGFFLGDTFWEASYIAKAMSNILSKIFFPLLSSPNPAFILGCRIFSLRTAAALLMLPVYLHHNIPKYLVGLVLDQFLTVNYLVTLYFANLN
ncbi:alr0828 [Nostoc sp. PCC 7120 = FACHB-418]|nr:alr0828 [Nostoc sp. PCC 7120 = FACHB-418]